MVAVTDLVSGKKKKQEIHLKYWKKFLRQYKSNLKCKENIY